MRPPHDEATDGPPLRGWLSDIFFPALLGQDGATAEGLARRLGLRASLAEPLFGRSEGDAVTSHLRRIREWLHEREATFTRTGFVMGTDRDATLGELHCERSGLDGPLPVAVVAEKRRAREVELRIYFAGGKLGGKTHRGPLVHPVHDLPLPGIVTDFLAALSRGAVGAALEAFETTGALVDPFGGRHDRASGALETFLQTSALGAGGVELTRGGVADDGRVCAVEYTLTRLAGRSVDPQAGFAVFERGDSGLLASLRFYADWAR